MKLIFFLTFLYSLNGFSSHLESQISELNHSINIHTLPASLNQIKTLLSDQNLDDPLRKRLMTELFRVDHYMSVLAKPGRLLTQSLKDCYQVARERGFTDQNHQFFDSSDEELKIDFSFLEKLKKSICEIDLEDLSDVQSYLFFEMSRADSKILNQNKIHWKSLVATFSEGLSAFRDRNFPRAQFLFQNARMLYGNCVSGLWIIKEDVPTLHRLQAHWISYLESISHLYTIRLSSDPEQRAQLVHAARNELDFLFHLSQKGVGGTDLRISHSFYKRMKDSLNSEEDALLPFNPVLPFVSMPLNTSLFNRVRKSLSSDTELSEQLEMTLQSLKNREYRIAGAKFSELEDRAIRRFKDKRLASTFRYYRLLCDCAQKVTFSEASNSIIHEEIMTCFNFVQYEDQGRFLLQFNPFLEEHRWIIELESYFRPII